MFLPGPSWHSAACLALFPQDFSTVSLDVELYMSSNRGNITPVIFAVERVHSIGVDINALWQQPKEDIFASDEEAYRVTDRSDMYPVLPVSFLPSRDHFLNPCRCRFLSSSQLASFSSWCGFVWRQLHNFRLRPRIVIRGTACVFLKIWSLKGPRPPSLLDQALSLSLSRTNH